MRLWHRTADAMQDAFRLNGRMQRCIGRKPDDIANSENARTPGFESRRTPKLAVLIRFDGDRRQIQRLGKSDRTAKVNDIRAYSNVHLRFQQGHSSSVRQFQHGRVI